MENRVLNSNEVQNSTIEPHVSVTSEPYFFTTSAAKLALMSICTFGIYDLYWFYENWTLIEKRSKQNIMPFWRAFFAPFWAYSCFEQIEEISVENNINATLSIGFLAVSYFIIQALWRLPDPYWLTSFLSFVPIIPANQAALAINNHLVPNFKNNDKFTGWNWVGLIVGGLLFILCILGTFFPLDVSLEDY